MIQTLPLLSLRAIECLGLSDVRITLAGTICLMIRYGLCPAYPDPGTRFLPFYTLGILECPRSLQMSQILCAGQQEHA
jgi:hypothetical protein